QGPIRQKLEDADRWLQEGHIEGPLSAAEHALERIENGTQAAAEAVAGTGNTVSDRLARWNARITDARRGMADAQTRIATGLRDAREGMNRIDKPIEDFAEVVGAIDRGEGDDWRGTLGRLVNDPMLADDLEDATVSLAETTASFDRFKTWLGGRFEYNFRAKGFRIYATAEIYARPDKFYLIEAERSGLGPHRDELTDQPNTDAYTRREVILDQQRFTAQFGKRFGGVQLRAGIKDSTAGVGADLLLVQNRLKISADLFGSYYRTPRVKLAAGYAVWRQLYILGGVDDALSPHGQLPVLTGNSPVPGFFKTVHYGRDYFVGAALSFTDEDIAVLLRIYGAMLVGLL
ncbi:MAG TPA: hypothetical protein VK427_27140, partial [Kofleriaceae bacterium]|nr:hypothetical protein [Kofleriaceae bacterium]